MKRWPMLALVFTFVLTIVIAVLSARASANRAIEQSRMEAARSAEAGRRATCLVIKTQENVFKEAESPVGQDAAEAWHDLGVLFRCDER